ncbi:deacylase [Ectothiorhodospiraceae bacterium BW-2]|nr:deacylase [Ectothiorhodospiraceae bacterium BW-2]
MCRLFPLHWLCCAILIAPALLHASHPEFSLHRLHSAKPGPTVLIIGGIQGDEPGGFHAATLLVTHAKLQNGELWVVPNLNFASILHSARGLHGDLNRKFYAVSPHDPDYHAVKQIQELITSPAVDIVINMHDGSGFYRPNYQDSQHNPHRWGQAMIIDQQQLANSRWGALEELATRTLAQVNQQLLHPNHRLHLKNTRTRDGDIEMEKSLTYFAIRHHKPALALEASKTLSTAERVYYHLQMLSHYLREIGMDLHLPFSLTTTAIEQALNPPLQLTLPDRLQLPLENIRSQLNYFPLPTHTLPTWQSNNPLLAVVNRGDSWQINYGNRRLTQLKPQFFDYSQRPVTLQLEIDGRPTSALTGTEVVVEQQLKISAPSPYRINFIGWQQPGIDNEVEIPILYEQIDHRFSLDRDGKLFRLEVYHQEAFSGMVTVRFDPTLTLSQRTEENPE